MAFDWEKLARDADASRERLARARAEMRAETVAAYEKQAVWLAGCAERHAERGNMEAAAIADARAVEFFNKAADAA